MDIRKKLRLTVFGALALSATAAHAQRPIPPDPDPTRLANPPIDSEEAEHDWEFQLGAGALYGPVFLGSKDYQLQIGPSIAVRYKDRFHASVLDGVGFDVLKTKRFRVGPIIRYEFGRDEDGSGPLVVAGADTKALIGLGEVAGTAEAGGYVQYQAGGLSGKIEVRQAMGGHKGLIVDVGARYSTRLPGITIFNRPMIISVGPRAAIVDNKYNQAYFGVDAAQSARSGLGQFNARSGLLSYGFGVAIVLPVSRTLSVAMLGGFDRLSGDAGNSPLVRERGSPNQGTIGVGVLYSFGR